VPPTSADCSDNAGEARRLGSSATDCKTSRSRISVPTMRRSSGWFRNSRCGEFIVVGAPGAQIIGAPATRISVAAFPAFPASPPSITATMSR